MLMLGLMVVMSFEQWIFVLSATKEQFSSMRHQTNPDQIPVFCFFPGYLSEKTFFQRLTYAIVKGTVVTTEIILKSLSPKEIMNLSEEQKSSQDSAVSQFSAWYLN